MSSTLQRPPAPVWSPEDLRPAHAPTVLVARFRCSPAADAWRWSREMHVLLGVRGDGSPVRARHLLDLMHPTDRHRTRSALARCVEGRAFSVEVRVTRPDGSLRSLVLAGTPVRDDLGHVVGVDGVCVDVTEGRQAPEHDRTRELETEVAQLRTAMAGRAPIEQAKGILMLLTGCSDQPAFDLLAHMSSHTHRKVRDVAVALTRSACGHEPLPDDVAAILRDACPPGAGHH